MGSRYSRPLLSSLVLILASGLTAGAALAQDLGGTVLDEANGLPISGALIEALDAEDRVLSRALTGGTGRFLLRGLGRRSVSHVIVVRIGYETERISVALVKDYLLIEVSREPIELAGLGVVGDSPCEVGREGTPWPLLSGRRQRRHWS